MKHVYTIIQQADLEVLGVTLFCDVEKAHEFFDKIVSEDELTEEPSENWSPHELDGTLRLAGDDCESVQLLRREIIS